MKNFILVRLVAVFIVIIAGAIGIGLGLSLAETTNIRNVENLTEFNPDLPTKLLDASDEVITEFVSEEKRELVALNELPRHLILAVLTREDPDFYNHKGFSLRGILRAAFGEITGRNLGGGSTITQQVAGTLYCNRMERTLSRKIRELWWAFQMERRFSKNEILEIYLNYMNMGAGTYGVEASSRYFFGHSARDVTLAEAAVLVVLLSSPTNYNPLLNPNLAMGRQKDVLDKMVDAGYVTREEADVSFTEYWDNYDYTRVSASAYYSREDKAPWFSEYVRRELDRLMYGEMDYYRDGYTVHTTMDMKFQSLAETSMSAGIVRGNDLYQRISGSRLTRSENTFIPIVNLLTLTFNLGGVHAAGEGQDERRAVNRYTKTINQVVDMASLVFDLPELESLTKTSYTMMKDITAENVVEGALIVLENDTGYIKAIVGGSKYDANNQLIRATQAQVMPGSAFKPLYYSAAIDSRQFTMSSLIYDSPMVFESGSGIPYIPNNYSGTWRGPVLLYEALALSLNIPALKILDGIGFDAAINRSADLLGITDPAEKQRTFPRVYPLGLGISSVSPLQMARAFAIFANQGRDVTPLAIRTVEDRNGRIVIDYERDIRLRQQEMGSNIQVISPQNAYIMMRLLAHTISIGTLASGSGFGSKLNVSDDKGVTYRIPAGGKTGTTQNWSDAWAVGSTPYYTIAIWFGFDKPGNSLGNDVTGASLAAPIWGDLMHEYNQGLPRRDFVRPSGVVDATVCRASGLLPTEDCPSRVTLSFLAGTVPAASCDQHGPNANSRFGITDSFTTSATLWGGDLASELQMPVLPPELLNDLPGSVIRPNDSPGMGVELPSYNPLLD
ncbi:MAG: PBP1A family penicillin-binding protein [Treponema sp.]|jgi:penicillin-binding protein 1A|nr:PBP1A family penicillin-binding protein [Treponema sp.]